MKLDPALKSLLTLAQSGLSAGVVLFVKGQIVKGDLISTSDYLARLQRLAQMDGEENPLSKEYGAASTGAKELAHSDAEPAFIHLKNVVVEGAEPDLFKAENPVSFDLEAVDGWSIGRKYPEGKIAAGGRNI